MKRALEIWEQQRDVMANDPEYQEYRQRYPKDLEYFSTGGKIMSRGQWWTSGGTG